MGTRAAIEGARFGLQTFWLFRFEVQTERAHALRLLHLNPEEPIIFARRQDTIGEMPAPPAKLDLIATSTFGLEAVVVRELSWLGYEAKVIQPGRVLFAGDELDICRANLWLRTADRVLLRLGAFEALDFGQLFERTQALPWNDWLPVDAEFPVSGRSVKSQLSSVPACQKIVKKAIVQRLHAAYGVEWFAETGPSAPWRWPSWTTWPR